MAIEVRVFSINVPKGGTALHPQVFDLGMPPRIVNGVEFFVPHGTSGQLWFSLGSGNTRFIPANADAYITADGEVIKWPLDHQIESGAWKLFAYNTGSFSHLIQIRFLLSVPELPQPATINLTETLSVTFEQTDGGGGGGGGDGGGSQDTFSVPTTIGEVDLAAGGSVTAAVLIHELGDPNPSYTASVVGLPTTISAFTHEYQNPLRFSILLNAAANAAAGTSLAAVQVSSGSEMHSSDMPVKVTSSAPPAAPTLNVTPSTIAQGGTLTVTGANWSVSTGITLLLAGIVQVVNSDANGAINSTYLVSANTAPGSYTMTASVNKLSASAGPITVTAQAAAPTFSVAPTNVNPGGVLNFYGANWGAGTTVTLSLAGTTLNVSADSTGAIGGAFTLSGSAVPGSYTMTAVTGALSAPGVAITVSAPAPPPPQMLLIRLNNSTTYGKAGQPYEFVIQAAKKWYYYVEDSNYTIVGWIQTDDGGYGVLLPAGNPVAVAGTFTWTAYDQNWQTNGISFTATAVITS